MEEIKNSFWQCLLEIPVSINASYGDAFQPLQWNDTLNKLSILASCGHKGPVMIGSKYIITDAQFEEINRINQNVWLFIAITGLDKCCAFSMQEYEEYYFRACRHLKNVVCAIRPIIPMRNDNMDTLLPVIQMVGKGRKMLTYTGFKDSSIAGSPQYRNEPLFNFIEQKCREYSILCFEKSVCIVCAVNQTDCFVHCKTIPINLDLIEAFGYKFNIDNGQLIITGHKNNNNLSKGDISFIKMLSKSSLVSGNISSLSQILSFRIDNTPLVSTSSWFNWARQTNCIVGCDYCFAGYDSKTRIELDYYGCNPTDLIKILQ